MFNKNKHDDEIKYNLSLWSYQFRTFKKMSGTIYTRGETGILLGDIGGLFQAVLFLEGHYSKDLNSFAVEITNKGSSNIKLKLPLMNDFNEIDISLDIIDREKEQYRLTVI